MKVCTKVKYSYLHKVVHPYFTQTQITLNKPVAKHASIDTRVPTFTCYLSKRQLYTLLEVTRVVTRVDIRSRADKFMWTLKIYNNAFTLIKI